MLPYEEATDDRHLAPSAEGGRANGHAGTPNLYERLGGVYSIATVVDDLIDRVMADRRLNSNPLVDDAHRQGTAGRI